MPTVYKNNPKPKMKATTSAKKSTFKKVAKPKTKTTVSASKLRKATPKTKTLASSNSHKHFY